MKVLIVDDHELVRHGLALIVQDMFEDAEIEECATAVDALEVLKTGPVDAALVDVRMPEVDGIELLKEIKATWPAVPVMMLTTFDDAKYARAALAAGAAGYMLKDSSPTDLAQAIRVAVSGGGNVLSSRVIQNLFDDLQPKAPPPAQPANLTHRELEILELLVDGQSNKDIANRLYLSEKTVKAHLAAVFRKLNVTNRTQAAMLALNMGLGSNDAGKGTDEEPASETSADV
jgi:DNA-binding NarL/FixJ family response regulator